MVYDSVPSSKTLGKQPAKSNSSVGRNGRNSHLTPPLTPNGVPRSVSHGPPIIPPGEVRQRRTLPSRTRRGGPGVGSCDIDMNILDTLKRTGENDPLIPPNSVFILTTDVNLVPPASSSNLGLKDYANERYFDKPEVIKSYREQQEIQTPEYTQLQDEALVGGRLRARGEIDSSELSDAAYEKRHRKYEAFERRQRLREKEKLQYEHYKLKERIEQLRNMDYTAFLALPDDVFGDVFVVDLPTIDGEISSVPTPLQEGERRRKLMLDVAMSLEERYRTLLPSDRKVAEKRGERASLSISVEPRTREQSVNDIDLAWKEPAQEAVSVRQPMREPMLRQGSTSMIMPAPTSPPAAPAPIPTLNPVPIQMAPRLPSPNTPSISSSPKPIESIPTAKENGVKLKITLRPSSRASFTEDSTPQSKRRSRRTAARAASLEGDSQPNVPPSESEPSPAPLQSITEAHTVKEPIIIKDATPVLPLSYRPPSFLGPPNTTSPNHHYQVIRFVPPTIESSIPKPHSRKRPKLAASEDVHEPQVLSFVAEPTPRTAPAVFEPAEQVLVVEMPSKSPTRSPSPVSSRQENLSASSGRRQQMPVILVAASHNEGPEARKTSRTVLAFGVKVPQFQTVDFELPGWLLDGDEESSNEVVSDSEQQASISLMMLHNGNQNSQAPDHNHVHPGR